MSDSAQPPPRRAPKIVYPPELPVSGRVEDIAAAIGDNQVVIVAGETGSGKTTQLPKICMELGRGTHARIGHTQPRRIAARSVAERIASELNTDVGDVVGWKVRFNDVVGDAAMVKVMTDGILLAEIAHDRQLRAYDTLIIDEAHERSLNIDFLLGYLKRLLPKRPDLKVVITSATIDPERFAAHFADRQGKPAPIVEVSGRTYPVEVRYRPIVDVEDGRSDKDRDQVQAICSAVTELSSEEPGDILVFLSGEREIRDTADALSTMELRDTEILPLYARLSSAEQHRVFERQAAGGGWGGRGGREHRRIVLATNVAETSLTVPGIKYVIDPGTARISRYSNRLKVQRLPIEPISQASANQRKGRCGRVSDGVCIRLYSEDDFRARPEFTDPEILRTNLASVILQMTASNLGDIAHFPFLEPPDGRQIADGVALLTELGALKRRGDRRSHGAHRLTGIGRKLAQLPVDPRMGRMIVEAERNGCLREVMIIAAALSIQDPRERPAEHREAADAKHRRFNDDQSDFLTYLNLWEYLRKKQKELSSSRFRRMCRQEYLNYLRVREWQDLYNQLRDAAKSAGINVGSRKGRADYDRIHISILSGMLSHIGLKDIRDKDKRSSVEFLGARGARFAVFPASTLFRRTPHWVMAAELVETSRLWGRIVARIEPEWVEKLAGHLVKRNYAEPHWERKQAAVIALERVTLYGVPLVEGRKVNYGKIDPEMCRDLFIRHALVEGDWDTHHKFFHENRELLDEAVELENRARRGDIVVDDQALFEFYDQRIPADVVSGRHFDAWWKKAKQKQPNLLSFDLSMLVSDTADDISDAEYPTTWSSGEVDFDLTYQFEPGSAADGVTVDIPLTALNRVDENGFAWQVPGMRQDLVAALIKSLPKPVRRQLVPAPDTAAEIVDGLEPGNAPLLTALEDRIRAVKGVDVPSDAWDWDKVPDYLRITARIVDDEGNPVAEGKDLADIKQRLAGKVQTQISAAASDVERHDLRKWDFGKLEQVFEVDGVKGYPALVDNGETVDVKVFATPYEQAEAMHRGTRRLVLLNVPSPKRALRSGLSNQDKIELAANPHSSVGGLIDDCVNCAADKVIADAGGPRWTQEEFADLIAQVKPRIGQTVVETVGRMRKVLRAWRDAQAALDRTPDIERFRYARQDVEHQMDDLIYAGFAADAGFDRLPDIERYLRAIERRLERLPRGVEADADRTAVIGELTARYQTALDAIRPGQGPSEALKRIRWMIEELRVSLFAQTLGTAYPVSEKRVWRALDEAASDTS